MLKNADRSGQIAQALEQDLEEISQEKPSRKLKVSFCIASIVLGLGAVGAVFAAGDLTANLPNTIALSAVAFGTVAVSVLGFLISKETDQAVATSHANAATANLRAEEAAASAAEAHLKAGAANERAASTAERAARLEVEVEQLTVERFRLQRELGPRNLTEGQVRGLNAALPTSMVGMIVAFEVHPSKEAVQYAQQLATLLDQRGANVRQIDIQGLITIGVALKDIEVTVLFGPGANEVEHAFKAAGFESVRRMLPRENELPGGTLMYDHNVLAAFVQVREKPAVVLDPTML